MTQQTAIKIAYRRMHPEAQLYQLHETDAAYDLTAMTQEVVTVHANGDCLQRIGTGIAVAIPPGYAGIVAARSSIVHKGVQLANGIGIIDAGYTGEIAVMMHCPAGAVGYQIGERCAQLMIVPIVAVQWCPQDVLESTARGEGGFGSTGG